MLFIYMKEYQFVYPFKSIKHSDTLKHAIKSYYQEYHAPEIIVKDNGKLYSYMLSEDNGKLHIMFSQCNNDVIMNGGSNVEYPIYVLHVPSYCYNHDKLMDNFKQLLAVQNDEKFIPDNIVVIGRKFIDAGVDIRYTIIGISKEKMADTAFIQKMTQIFEEVGYKEITITLEHVSLSLLKNTISNIDNSSTRYYLLNLLNNPPLIKKNFQNKKKKN